MSIRVHILAKELGVSSKAILDKSRAEGLDIKNHMTVLSAGLDATIREWFSEGEHETTEETTERVNMEKMRSRRKRKKEIASLDLRMFKRPDSRAPKAVSPMQLSIRPFYFPFSSSLLFAVCIFHFCTCFK